MRFIKRLSYNAADSLTRQINENHEKRRLYYYGFQVVFGGITKLILLALLALVTGTVKPTVFIVLMFAGIRVFAGGYHMDTYGKCIVVSLILFSMSAVISQYTYNYWNIEALIVFVLFSFAITLYSLYKWAPAENPNRPITNPEEIRKFRVLSMVYIVIWAIIVSMLIYFKLKLYVLASCFPVLLESWAISPLGYRFFNFLDNRLSNMENRC